LIVYVDGLANANMLVASDDPAVQPRREYFAFGASSLLSGLFGGFVTGTSSSRSIVGIRAGEKSRVAGAIAGVLMLATALSAIGFLAPMPLPALAGVVFVAAIDLIDRKRLREMFRIRRADFWIAMFAAAAVVFVGMVQGILIGIAAALVEVFRRAMYPNRQFISDRVGDRLYEPFSAEAIEREDTVLVYRFGTALFFGNAESFRDDMRDIARNGRASLRRVMINADGLGVPDATARDCLIEARTTLAKRGIELVFGNARKALRDALARIGGFTLVDEDEFLAAVRAAHLHGRSA
jgi:SulP family sulfate permease